ncbi:MAG: sulfotransferase [Flavobacteriales bacterium]|nr:sulfotransferase [Flavobacteriales bacterium]
MQEKKFIFISGLNRSGTSLLYKILKEQDEISGLSKTNELEDEGQHVQTVYKPAYEFGGVGKFGFDINSRLDENSKLINEINRKKLFNEWSRFWDLEKNILLEKSPPNIVRTRFLQKMFPNSYFINITRHPIATSIASKKWSKTSLDELISHWIKCHEIFNEDKKMIRNIINIKYEDLINNNEEILAQLSKFLKLNIKPSKIEIRKGINDKYFKIWIKKSKSIFTKYRISKIIKKHNNDIEKFDYSLIKL